MYLHLLKYYAEILRWERLGVDTTRRLQVEKFRRVFEHARAHSKFYRTLYGDSGVLDLQIRSMQDIERLPIIDKQSLRHLAAEDVLTIPANDPDLCSVTTSGSTGEPMTLYATKREYYTAHVRVFRSLQRCGYHPLKSIASIFHYDPDRELAVEQDLGLLSLLQRRFGLFRRSLISCYQPVDEIIETLRSIRPDLLWSVPSSMAIVARRLRDLDLELDIPVAFGPSETIDPAVRTLLEERVARRIVNAYGLQECPSIALEARTQGQMDVFAESTLVEWRPRTDRGEGRHGELVITNLLNRTMPIIRYATGDLCDPMDDPRFPSRVIGPVLGRIDDTIMLSDGTEFAVTQANPTFAGLTEARQWKLVATRDGIQIHVQVQPSHRGREARVAERARRMWRARCPHEPLEVVFTDEFAIDPRTGKSKLIEDRTRE